MGRRRRRWRESRPARPAALALARQCGLLRWRDWASLGIANSQVSCALTRVAPGIYAPSAERVTDALIVAKRVPRGILCLLSAAHFHGLAEEPEEVWLALGRKDWRPRVRKPLLRTVRFSGPALTEGVEQHCRWGVPVQVYSAAKTVTDLFRYRAKSGFRPAVSVMRSALWLGRCTVEQLRTLAAVCRVERLMAPYLEAAARLPVQPVQQRFVEMSGCRCHRRTATGRLVAYSPAHGLEAIYGRLSDRAALAPLPPDLQALSDQARWSEEEEHGEPEPPRILRLEATP